MYLENVPEEKAFVIGDMRILNLKELLKQIKLMNDNDYSHYVSSDHNYFADWIFAVVGHEDLAKDLRKANTKKDLIKKLSLEIKILETPKEEIIEKEDEIVIVEDKEPEIVDDAVKSEKKSKKKTKTKKTSKKSAKKPKKEKQTMIETSEEEKIETELNDLDKTLNKEKTESKDEEKEEEPEVSQADYLEIEDMLKKISTEKHEVKHLLWKHFAWDLAKEFMYGLAIGIFVGLILSRILLP